MIKDADSMGPEVAAGRWMMGGVLKIGKYSFADQTRMGWEREVLSLTFETRRGKSCMGMMIGLDLYVGSSLMGEMLL
ncbi:hypothetical protein QQP08_027622 [Theobroma cacao]|nr:hypothetical protein QQP08_027622 [Theobroma cacao]